MKKYKNLGLILLCAAIIISAAGCSSTSKDDSSSAFTSASSVADAGSEQSQITENDESSSSTASLTSSKASISSRTTSSQKPSTTSSTSTPAATQNNNQTIDSAKAAQMIFDSDRELANAKTYETENTTAMNMSYTGGTNILSDVTNTKADKTNSDNQKFSINSVAQIPFDGQVNYHGSYVGGFLYTNLNSKKEKKSINVDYARKYLNIDESPSYTSVNDIVIKSATKINGKSEIKFTLSKAASERIYNDIIDNQVDGDISEFKITEVSAIAVFDNSDKLETLKMTMSIIMTIDGQQTNVTTESTLKIISIGKDISINPPSDPDSYIVVTEDSLS